MTYPRLCHLDLKLIVLIVFKSSSIQSPRLFAIQIATSILCADNAQCTVYRAQPTMHSAQGTVHSAQSTDRHRLEFGYWWLTSERILASRDRKTKIRFEKYIATACHSSSLCFMADWRQKIQEFHFSP